MNDRRRQSLGEYRVGVRFNPADSPDVDFFKTLTADIIDRLQIWVDIGDEAGRCAREAQVRYEDAAMWAVKAVTKEPRT